MVAANLKMQEIPVAVTRADVVREMRRMLDKKIAKTMQQLRKYENDGNEEMANCMDWYAEGMEYALACILSLDEEYKKAYTVKVGGK
jgi:hypothetical protein